MMKARISIFAALLAAGAIGAQAQFTVATEDFESYPSGVWNASNAPTADPVYYGGTSGTIHDVGGINQELVVDMNLSNQYNVGMSFLLPMSGNQSRSILDYEMDVYFRVDPATWNSLTNTGLTLTLYNPSNVNQGTEMKLSELPEYGDAVTNGGVLHAVFDSSAVFVRWDKSQHITADIPEWRVDFSFGLGGLQGQVDQPITIALDDIIVRYTAPPLVSPSGTPTGYQTTNDLAITGMVLDGSSQVDILELHLDGAVVNTASNMAGGASVTNIITYDAAGLSKGAHWAAVKGYDAGTNTIWHQWSFYVAGDAAEPATNILALYNLNIAGGNNGNGGGVFVVTNGTQCAAPSLGSNSWVNAMYNNPWWLGNVTPQISDAGGTLGNITYEALLAGSKNLFPEFWWYGDQVAFANSHSGTVWSAGLNAGDYDVELRNVDEGLTYDLYLYYTSPTTNGLTTTTYTLINGYAPSMSVTLESTQAAISGDSQTTNYVALTEITPIGGKIAFNVVGGGLSALQLTARRPVASVMPNIHSLDVSGGMVDLSFDSEEWIDYKVLRSANLGIPSWTEVTNGIPGQGSTTSVSVPSSGGTEFFVIEGE